MDRTTTPLATRLADLTRYGRPVPLTAAEVDAPTVLALLDARVARRWTDQGPWLLLTDEAETALDAERDARDQHESLAALAADDEVELVLPAAAADETPALCGEHGHPLTLVPGALFGTLGCAAGCEIHGADVALETGTTLVLRSTGVYVAPVLAARS